MCTMGGKLGGRGMQPYSEAVEQEYKLRSDISESRMQ